VWKLNIRSTLILISFRSCTDNFTQNCRNPSWRVSMYTTVPLIKQQICCNNWLTNFCNFNKDSSLFHLRQWQLCSPILHLISVLYLSLESTAYLISIFVLLKFIFILYIYVEFSSFALFLHSMQEVWRVK